MGLHAYVNHEGYSVYASDADEFWTGSYGAFNVMRAAICRAAGWPLECVNIGSANKPHWIESAAANGLKPNAENYLGCWAERPADILAVLLLHSDCDGRIYWAHAADLADRLAGLRGNLKNHCPQDWEYGGFIDAFDRMVAALRNAAERVRDVEFH